MEAKEIAVAGAVALGIATIGYFGYKKFRKTPEPAKPAEVKVTPKPAPVVKEKQEVQSEVTARPTLSVVKTEKLVEKEELRPVNRDRVGTVIVDEEEVVSVARARVADDVPSFWVHFYNNIRRPEVVELKPEDFCASNRPALSKGYHRAVIEGFDAPAVVHVTKGHVSAVVHLGGSVFMGFSTSGSRFQKVANGEAIPGTFSLTAVQAKDFLNGR